MSNEICECGHFWNVHRDKDYDADVAGSKPGMGSCTDCPCFRFTAHPDEGDDFEKVAEAYVAQTLDGQLGASSPTKFQLIQFVLWGMNYTRQQLAAERTRREEAIELIKRFRQWDHLDNAADGPYWKRTIDTLLAAQDSSSTSESGADLEANQTKSGYPDPD